MTDIMTTEVNRLPSILQPTNEDIALLLAAKCHLGSKNVNNCMKNYMFSRRADGIFIIHLSKLWEKLILAARVLATIEEGQDIYVTSSSFHGRRPANKISTYLHTLCNIGRFSPGTFTKSIQEPRLLLCMDPYDDAQAISESSKCNIPVIAFVNSHSPLKYVDIAIPCNNMGSQSIGVMCWLLTRAVLRLRRAVDYDTPWQVIPDMFFYTENTNEMVEEDEEYPSNQQKYNNKSFGGGDESWSDDNKRFSFDGDDDGVDWQNNNPKATGNGWDGNDDQGNDTTMTFNTNWSNQGAAAPTAFGSSDRTYDLNGFGQPPERTPPLPAPTRHVDWADDLPEEEHNDDQAVGWGGGAPTTDDNQWKGAGNTPWGP